MKTTLKKEKGTAEYVLAFLGIIIILLLVLFAYQKRTIKIIKNTADDGLVASILASALIDIQEYGALHHIVITDPDPSYQIYLDAITDNLETPYFRGLILSDITVYDYIIYNVRGTDVEEIAFDQNGLMQIRQHPGQAGSIRTPDDVLVTSTAVYGRIGYEIRGYISDTHYVYTEKTVDIVAD